MHAPIIRVKCSVCASKIQCVHPSFDQYREILLYAQKIICFWFSSCQTEKKKIKKPQDRWMEKCYFTYYSPTKYCKQLDEDRMHNLFPCRRDKELQRFHLLIWPTEILETDDAAVLESFGDILTYVLIVLVSLNKETTLPLQSSPWVVS